MNKASKKVWVKPSIKAKLPVKKTYGYGKTGSDTQNQRLSPHS